MKEDKSSANGLNLQVLKNKKNCRNYGKERRRGRIYHHPNSSWMFCVLKFRTEHIAITIITFIIKENLHCTHFKSFMTSQNNTIALPLFFERSMKYSPEMTLHGNKSPAFKTWGNRSSMTLLLTMIALWRDLM